MSTVRDMYEGLPRSLRENLDALLNGLTVAQTCRFRGVREDTVKSQRQAIYRHFGVKSQSELLAKALRIALGREGGPVVISNCTVCMERITALGHCDLGDQGCGDVACACQHGHPEKATAGDS